LKRAEEKRRNENKNVLKEMKRRKVSKEKKRRSFTSIKICANKRCCIIDVLNCSTNRNSFAS
jgi:hypothetical protein